jgi:hypothetical protein
MKRWLVASVLFAAYWGVMSAVWVELPSAATRAGRVAVLAALILVPSALAGILVARPWAPAITLGLVLLVPIPGHCVTDVDFDVITTSCSALSLDDLPMHMTWAGACITAGVIARSAILSARRSLRPQVSPS